jgi:hypothetical protein
LASAKTRATPSRSMKFSGALRNRPEFMECGVQSKYVYANARM